LQDNLYIIDNEKKRYYFEEQPASIFTAQTTKNLFLEF